MIYILLLFINSISAEELFAGNGLRTYLHTILHNRTINMNCTTYDDCYALLCSYILQPDEAYVIIKPNEWKGNCGTLNNTDNRLLDADFGYNNNYYETKTVSDASLLLCKLSNTPKQIYYFIYNCSFAK